MRAGKNQGGLDAFLQWEEEYKIKMQRENTSTLLCLLAMKQSYKHINQVFRIMNFPSEDRHTVHNVLKKWGAELGRWCSQHSANSGTAVWIPSTHPVWALCNPSAGKRRQEDPWVPRPSESMSTGWEALSQKKTKEGSNWRPGIDLWHSPHPSSFSHAHSNTHMHAYTNSKEQIKEGPHVCF